MAAPNTQIDGHVRSRRSHTKSRHGCMECKRRRVKCDEKKPACSRCVSMMQKCKYSPLNLSLTRFVQQPSLLPSPPDSSASLSPFHLDLPLSPAYEFSSNSPDPIVVPHTSHQTPAGFDGSPFDLSEMGLYQHYLEHTGCTLTQDSRDQSTLESRMPAMALQHKPVLHALLAASAICLCCDRMSTDTANASDIEEALMTGYHHYHLASKMIRGLLSNAKQDAAEAIVCSNVLLIPFAAASQQVNDWLSRHLNWPKPGQSLASTPRDIVTILRGVQVTFQALRSGAEQTDQSTEPALSPDQVIDMIGKSAKACEPTLPWKRHHMFPVLVETSEEAFLVLRSRLQSATANATGVSSEVAAAYKGAFDILDEIRSDIFAPKALSRDVDGLLSNNGSRATNLPSWLTEYVSRPAIASPDAPLTRPLLSFLVKIPQAYLGHVLPLLEQRLEQPVEGDEVVYSYCLSTLELLALDIYAHWSTLMFLVEEESWWIGDLPTITLSGMVNRFGSMLANQSHCQNQRQEQQWWPGRMLSIMQERKEAV